MVSTVLSKRSLKWFVEAGIADGWYDPRFPTVQGIMRRGLTVEALKQFMLEQGPSKNTNLMEWDKLWALNKDIIDSTTPRYTAIVKSSACRLIVENGPSTPEARSQPLHPKNDAVGSKAVIYGRELWIEKDDAISIEVGEKVTLMKWGNITITKKDNSLDGNPVLYGNIDESDKDFKKTKKITWVCADPDTTVEITLVELDHLITKKKIEENDDVKQLVNHNSRIEYTAIAEGSLRTIQRGASIQLERRGYFFIDQAATLGDKKLRLHFIPDGKSKSMSVISHKLDAKEIAGGKGKAEGANRAEAKKAAGGEDAANTGENGEAAPLSKKQAKKDAKKAEKKAAKAGGAGEEVKQEENSAAKKKVAAKQTGGKLLKIYNWRLGNPWVDLAVIAANFAHVQIEEVFNAPEVQQSKEWKAKSLTGKCPTLETLEGGFLNESAAIARYLAEIGEGKLAGSTPFEIAQINQWIDYVHTTLQPHMYNIILPTYGHGNVDAETFNHHMKEMKDIIRNINSYLQAGGKTHLVGNRLTVADIVLAIPLIMLFEVSLDGGFRKAVPNVASWLEAFIKLPEVVARIGHVKLCAKVIKPTLVEKKKEEAPKPAAQPKKAEKPAATAEDEEGEKKLSGKNPLDLLPPSKFVLPDFKTYFVNLGDKKATEGMQHFIDNYDPEGYSLWFTHYDKYEGEGVLLYQTSNLMNGFLQRMDDKFRNYTFSMMAILGEEPSLEIQGVWLFRGKTIPQEMLDHPQFEYYQKRELKIDNADDRKLISDFWCAKAEVSVINGLKVQECKMFK